MSRVLAKDLAGHGITQSLQDLSMRAIDNLSRFKSHIKEHKMEDKVTKFEEGDDPFLCGCVSSLRQWFQVRHSRVHQLPFRLTLQLGACDAGSYPQTFVPSIRASSIGHSQSRRPSFSRLNTFLAMSSACVRDYSETDEGIEEENLEPIQKVENGKEKQDRPFWKHGSLKLRALIAQSESQLL